MQRRCARPSSYQPARVPGDLAEILGPLTENNAFAELSPEVLSTDPWVVYFHKFLQEDEVSELDQYLFSREFKRSAAGYGGKSSARQSETAFCVPPCDEHPAVQAIYQRASNITRVPIENIDFVQAARYKPGMFFMKHHDNHPTFRLLPCGARIFSIFVYLTDVEEGGATAFPQLGLEAPARRGAAVLFQNTLDSDPDQSDRRTEHEALEVVRGEKHGINMWLYQYNYRESWQKKCISIELADDLQAAGLTAAEPVSDDNGTEDGDDGDEGYYEDYVPESLKTQQKSAIFENTSPTEVEIFWVNDKDEEILMGIAQQGRSLTLNTFPRHNFHARVKDSSRTLVTKYTAGEGDKQHVDVTPSWLDTEGKTQSKEEL